MIASASQYVHKALALSDALLKFAESGELNCQDDGCCVLSGVIRDCSYKIRQQADLERKRLWVSDQWENDPKER